MDKKLDKTILLLVLILIMALLLFVLFWFTFTDAREHDRNKTELIALSNNVLHDNDRLIKYLRSYVINRDENDRDAYLTLLNDPNSFNNRLVRMSEIGLTDIETEKAERIIEIWSRLEIIEDGILENMNNGEYEVAIQTVFSDEYLQNDYLLAATINELITNIENRSAEKTAELNLRLTIVMIFFSAAYLAITFALSAIYRNNRNLRDLYKKQKEDFELEATTLQYIFDSLPIAVRIASSEDLSLMYVNKSVVTLFGYEPTDDITDKKVTDFLSPEQPGGKSLQDIYIEASAGRTTTIEALCVKKNGELFMARISSCKITFKGKPAALATIEDITAQQEYMQKLENIAYQEHEANQLKSRFLATMSHEVRTPMNAILGITEILLQREILSTETEEALGKIYDSGTLLLNIINDILDLSKIEAGKLELHPALYDIPSLINDTVQLTRLRFDSSPVDFVLNVDAATPINIYGDELRVRQILNNLLSNAFKYTRLGRVTLSVSVCEPPDSDIELLGDTETFTDIDPSWEDIVLIFTISDTGQGMSQEQINKLFDEYTRFNVEVNRATVGTGLGMSITRRLVELMNGDIEVKSEVGKGSEFTVRIPQKKIDDLVCGAEMSDKLHEYRLQNTRIAQKSGIFREYMPYGTVLVVDDVETNIYVTRGLLLPYGIKVDTAVSGFETIDRIKAGYVYDIIFMDHMMPKMDGIQTVKLLREMGYTGSIVALTANALIGQAEVFLKNGFDGYISKPIDTRELNSVLNELIRNKKPAAVVKKARREQMAMHSDSHSRQRESLTSDKKRNAHSELKSFFITDADSAIKAFQSIDFEHGQVNEEDINTFEVTIHGVKSALRNIGEKDIAARAGKIEEFAHKRDCDILKKEAPAFFEELKEIIDKYSRE